jgi:hypothetical protein
VLTLVLGLVLAAAFVKGLLPGVRRRPIVVASYRRLNERDRTLTDDLVSALPGAETA